MTNETTVKELDNLIRDIFDQRATYEEASNKAKEENKKLEQLKADYVAKLEQLERTSYKSTIGTVSYRYEDSFKIPKGEENREKFFAYLKEKGMFDSMITVNSKTLNSFAKKEAELAEEKGELDFQLPGIEKGEPRMVVTMRKA